MKNSKVSLTYSIIDGFLFSVMVGLGESYFCAFSLSKGLSELFSGLLSSLPLMIGGLFQIFTPKLVHLFHSEKKFIVTFVVLQSLLFFYFAYLAEQLEIFPPTLFCAISLYWFLSFSATSAWNSWINKAVPKILRVKFFSKRSLYSYLGIFLGLTLGGQILQWGQNHGEQNRTYQIIFLLCGIVRFLSAWMLSLHQFHPRKRKILVEKVSLEELNFYNSKTFKLFSFVLVLKFFVYISSPYFSPYMLKQIHFSYNQYFVILSISFLGKISIMNFLKVKMKKVSIETIMAFSALGISLIPLAWSLSDNYYYLCTVEIFSGLSWGGFELTFFLLVLDYIPDVLQTKYMSIFNLFNALFLSMGSLVGGYFIKNGQVGVQNYREMFLVSSLGRFMAIFLLPQFIFHLKTSGLHSAKKLFRVHRWEAQLLSESEVELVNKKDKKDQPGQPTLNP